jgi:hypothetical protein
MSSWWKENKLEHTIKDYVDWPDRPGHDYEPSNFLQHLDAQGDDSYLHYGVNIYVRELYKDYNGVGHYALFQETKKKVTTKPRNNAKQPKTPERNEFEIALDAAKKAAEDKKLKQSAEKEKERKRLEAEEKEIERKRLEAEEKEKE